MLRTWLTYSVALLSTFIFFLCYKMWVSWFCLVVILLIPFLALGMCIIASRTLTFKTESPKSCPLGDPSYIWITMNGIASYFAFCKVLAEDIHCLANIITYSAKGKAIIVICLFNG